MHFALGVAASLLLAPASAFAADTFVDADTGADTNPCTQAAPCLTIQEGIDKATGAAVVHVDPDAYGEAVQAGDGKGMIADDFVGGPEGAATIDGGASPAIEVLASGAGTVSGFTITSATTPVINAGGPINLTGNSVVVPTVPTVTAFGIDVTAGVAGLVTIDDNEFSGDSTGQTAIQVRNGSDASVTHNRIGAPGEGFLTGILVFEGATAEIARNTVRALFSMGSAGGQGIAVQDATALITDNLVTDVQPLPDTVWGITVNDTSTAPIASATLRRNQLYGGGALDGVRVLDAAPVTMEGDLITGFDVGIRATDVSAANTTNANVDASGVTVYGNTTADIRMDSATLSLDSSIIGSEIMTTGTGIGGGAIGCAITFSRGPTTTAGGNGCADFQTSADPGFVDPMPLFGEPDLHLAAGSPMIDAGNPDPPDAGALDIDGEPRALDGDGECPEIGRRDIGADEFGQRLDCTEPLPLPPSGGAEAPELALAVRPKKRMTEPGKKVTFKAAVTNSGSGTAERVEICVRVPKRAKGQVKASGCRDVGTLDRGGSAKKAFKAKVTDAAHDKYRIGFTAKATNADKVAAKATLKVAG